MFPRITVFGWELGTYGICAGIGFLALLFCLWRLAPLRERKGDEEVVIVLLCIIPVVIGGSLLYGITNIPHIADTIAHAGDYSSPLALMGAIALSFNGIVYYGGLFGALACVVVYCRVKKVPLGDQLDLFAVGVPLFHLFGRIGCFMAGCCFGIECPIGFVYTLDPISWANGTARFPVQLLESACELVIFLVMLSLFRRESHRGNLIFGYLGAYAAVRFLDEFLRGDVYRGFLGPFSTSQWVSLGILVFLIVRLIVRHRRASRHAL